MNVCVFYASRILKGIFLTLLIHSLPCGWEEAESGRLRGSLGTAPTLQLLFCGPGVVYVRTKVRSANPPGARHTVQCQEDGREEKCLPVLTGKITMRKATSSQLFLICWTQDTQHMQLGPGTALRAGTAAVPFYRRRIWETVWGSELASQETI